MLSHGYGDSNPNNKWLLETAKFVLEEMQPTVFWGENAPTFASNIGKNIRNAMYKIGLDNGYTMSIYRTRSLLHGVPQVRERAFYFFWKGDKVPILDYYNTPYTRIEDLILNTKRNTQREPINPKLPTDDPYYKYVLEELHNGASHYEFSTNILTCRTAYMFAYIENTGKTYKDVGIWMQNNGYEHEVKKCEYKYNKLNAGGDIMRRGIMVPKDYIGAFVSHYPVSLTHPTENRYIDYREAMTIMGLPGDFELLDPKKSVNHICQNVPVQTARDMANEVKNALDGNRELVKAKQIFQYNGKRKHVITDEETSNLIEFIGD
jgi:site-specific DNA-cytosine methylase